MSSSGARVQVEGHDAYELTEGWEAASTTPDAYHDPAELGTLSWIAAPVPGTAASALAELGRWSPSDERDFDAEDWWFRTRFDASPAAAGEQVTLALDGLATVAEVHLNGEVVLRSGSMFTAHEIDVGERLRGENELAIRFRALAPMLRTPRRPRARWRTKVAADGNLRFFRTTLLGRAPGFAPRPAAVGPWRPVRLNRRRGIAVDELALTPRLVGADGVLEVHMLLRTLDGEPPARVELELNGPSGTHRSALTLTPAGPGAPGAPEVTVARGTLSIPAVARWWPHTHGDPALHAVGLTVSTEARSTRIDAGRVGFRTLAAGPHDDHELERDGLSLQVNGIGVFCRGVIWTPTDPVGLAPQPEALRASVESARDAGMNMLRLPGTGVYESPAFHELCDELGVLVWQDFMFANLDYPFADDEFRALVEREAMELVAGFRGRPSVAVLCGNSEIEQQVAMLGLDPELGRGEMFGHTLPAIAREAGVEAIYVPSAPCGGELPFRPDRGVANYFGVGAYLRPLEDARRAGVRFASECLAFANVPDQAGVDAVAPELGDTIVVHHPRWKAGVPRDVGTGWDFEDVRDHYLALLYGVEPSRLRSVEHERYLELSRFVSGELMAEVFGEWRRSASPCAGGLILWWRDLVPGAGWGVVDHAGTPKVAYHHLRRALAPVAVWTSDEGLGGIAVHAVNDRPDPHAVRLSVALYRNLEVRVAEAEEALELPAHGYAERTVEGMLGHFVDAAWAYRFGRPGHDAIVVSLRSAGQPSELLSQATRFPVGRPTARQSGDELGLEARIGAGEGGATVLHAQSRRLAYGVRVQVPGFVPADDAFCIEPGVERTVALAPLDAQQSPTGGTLTALNLEGAVRIAPPEP